MLPLVDLTTDQSLAYFCEGLAEEIIHALSGIPGLRVVPRASAFGVGAHASDPQQIRSVLNVTSVLQGSVRTSGNQVFVTARLTDAVTGVQRWAERFIRNMSDIVGVQEDIAARRAASSASISRPRPGSLPRSSPAAEARTSIRCI